MISSGWNDYRLEGSKALLTMQFLVQWGILNIRDIGHSIDDLILIDTSTQSGQ